MNTPQQIAQQFRQMHFGPSRVGSCLKELIDELTWEQAAQSLHGLHSVYALVFHINYYVAGVLQVFDGGGLDIRDKHSYDHPPIDEPQAWEDLKAKTWEDAERFAEHLDSWADEKLQEPFVDEKYGSYFRNMVVMLEHANYHIGQIAIVRKMVRAKQ